MQRVWDYSIHAGPRLLALLAIADAANEEGEGWLKRATIARRMRREETAAKRAVSDLVQSGELEIIGKTARGVNIYRVTVGLEPGSVARQGGENAPSGPGMCGGRKRPVEGGENAPCKGGENAPSHNIETNRPSNRPLTGAMDFRSIYDAVCEVCGWDDSKDPRIGPTVTNNLKIWQTLTDDFPGRGMEALRSVMAAYRDRHGDRVPAVSYVDKAFRSELQRIPQASFTDRLAMDPRKAVRVKGWVEKGFWLDDWGDKPSDDDCAKVRKALEDVGRGVAA